MKIDRDRYIDINCYNLENLPKFTPYSALDNLTLSQTILYGIEPYLVKIVEVISRSPECKNEERFWIECQMNRLISYYCQWFKRIIREFVGMVKVLNNTVEIKLVIGFVNDNNHYSYTYILNLPDQRANKDDFRSNI